jgi:hypothetical protein
VDVEASSVCFVIELQNTRDTLAELAPLAAIPTNERLISIRDIMSHLHDLPPELISSVCEYLQDRTDLRNVRLLNPAFNGAARRILFHTLYLTVNLSSFEKLQKIARHETLRYLVEVIDYDGVELARFRIPRFKKWLDEHATYGMGIPRDKRAQFLARFTQEQLHTYHDNFCRFLGGQERLLEAGNVLTWLTEALRGLPRLSVLNLIEMPTMEPISDPELQPLEAWAPLARQILAEPVEFDAEDKPRNQHFGELLLAAVCCTFYNKHFKSLRTVNKWLISRSSQSKLEYPHRVREIHGRALDPETFHVLFDIIPQLALEDLEGLSLEFFFLSSDSPSNNAAIVQLLQHTSELQSLRISFSDFPDMDYPEKFHLTTLLDSDFQWSCLKHLSLQSLVTETSRLKSLLIRHSKTLRSLELSHITLHCRENGGGWALKGLERTPWISTIHLLSEQMSLESIKLEGYFASDTRGNWTTFGKVSYLQTTRCLRYT